ncbi:MAG: patatin-like phospholipase family protein [Pseudohongiellaceae bacterium]
MAGAQALRRLNEQGFCPSAFRTLVGASGGPKWFVLYGLDRYLFGEFFAGRGEPLDTLGSSAGAWRMSCLARANPVGAIDRLAALYSNERYSTRPDAVEVTEKARHMLEEVLGTHGSAEIVANKIIRSHFVAARCRGPMSSRSQWILGTGLFSAALANIADRRLISTCFERTIFDNCDGPSPFADFNDLSTAEAKLTVDNLPDVLIASGSIPFALSGVRNIEGAKPGLYLDGGITDYHFDWPFSRNEDLVLYPHFYNHVIPGWFDKHLPWRRARGGNFSNVVVVAPTRDFVRSLPYGKIPDRRDFRTLDFSARRSYWQAVLKESARLADDFAHLVETGDGIERIQPFAEEKKE